jgi:hypothetical protein
MQDEVWPEPLDALPDANVTYNAGPQGWHLQMHGDTITGLVVNGKVLIAPTNLRPEIARSMRELVNQIDTLLEQEGLQ